MHHVNLAKNLNASLCRLQNNLHNFAVWLRTRLFLMNNNMHQMQHSAVAVHLLWLHKLSCFCDSARVARLHPGSAIHDLLAQAHWRALIASPPPTLR